MKITRIEVINKKKYKVEIEETFAFALYESEIKQYGLELEKEISEMVYHKIVTECVLPRAKKKALSLLKFQNRTEQELKTRLKREYYTEQIIKQTIEYVNSYHYIDDERYAECYIETKKGKKSKVQLQQELYQKGIAKEIVEQILEGYVGEEEALQKAIYRKTGNIEEMTVEEKRKLALSLSRKGFQPELIKKYLYLEE